MVDLFEGVVLGDDIGEIYEKLERNCPIPSTTSKRLWELRRECKVADHNKSSETLLEKAVANLAYNGPLLSHKHHANLILICSDRSGGSD